jgi:hypothetical protein
MSTERDEDEPRQFLPCSPGGKEQEEVIESEDDSLPITIGKSKSQQQERVKEKDKILRSKLHTDGCRDSPQQPTRREDGTESTAERTSLLDREGDHGGDGPLVGEEIEVRTSQRRRRQKKDKKKRKSNKKEKTKGKSREVKTEVAEEFQDGKKKKKSKKKKKKSKDEKDENDTCEKKIKQRRVRESSSASELGTETSLNPAMRRDRSSSSGRKKQDPEGDRSSVASSSVSSSHASHLIDASLSSICDDEDNDSDEDNEASCTVSLFLSPSNEFDSSGDDCFEPSPEWLESIRLKQQSYYYQRSSEALNLVARGGAQSITARNLDSEFIAGSQQEHSSQSLQQTEPGLDRPPFQSPMSDLTPDSYPSLSYPHPVVAAKDENADAARTSTKRFDPKRLPVICIPRGDEIGISQCEHLQKSWNAKQQRRQHNLKRRCWIASGFLAFNILLAIGVAIPFVLSLMQNKHQENDGLSTDSSSGTSPSSPQQVKCFETSSELESAVDEYLSQTAPISSNASIVQTYGYMSDWCVDSITRMDSLFSADRNPLVRTFNEPIGSWNVGSVTSMKAMFRSASRFNQDLSSWHVRRLQDLSDMFRDAREFRQNLCPWRSILPTSANKTNTFTNTSCDDAGAGSNGTSTSVFLCYECLTSY